ncbi:MAG TPA: hypothetical protein VHP33_11670 [Polyangiaceae bacterium]|nr:hypothetical protein [Polyangiaceae bacterium]
MQRRLPSLFLALTSVTAAALASCGDHDEPPGESSCQIKPSETFHERIEPLLVDGRKTTCNQCHLSGVDLSAFARETPCKTWACLVDQGLVDTRSPEDSKILGWIERASPDSDLITPQVIRAEHDAFQDWIEANAACPNACAGVTCGEPGDGPTCSDEGDEPPAVPSGEDTRGCSDMELEQAFYDDVYAFRGRCYPCHYETEADADKDAPRWISTVGNCQTGSAVTLKRAVALGLVNVNDPSQSLLLLKPLDSYGGGVPHGGGAKFTKADPTYVSFTRFIEHYAQCQQP